MTPTGSHTEDHERILAKVLVGDLDRNAPEVRTLVAECADCNLNLDELTSLSELMELEGREERELLASLDYDRKAPGSDLVAPFFEARVAELPEAPPRRIGWLQVAAAAAVLGGAGLWLMSGRLGVEAGPEQRVLLGSSSIRFLGGTGEVAQYETITWDAERLSSGNRFELTILDGSPGGDATQPLLKLRVEGNTWTPTDEQLLTLPDAIQVMVVALDVTGQPIGAPAVGSVSRSR